jgi:hypothetical protein
VSVLSPGEGRLRRAGKVILNTDAFGLGPTDAGDCIPLALFGVGPAVSVLLPGEGRLWAGKLIFDPGALGLGPTDVGDCIPEDVVGRSSSISSVKKFSTFPPQRPITR